MSEADTPDRTESRRQLEWQRVQSLSDQNPWLEMLSADESALTDLAGNRLVVRILGKGLTGGGPAPDQYTIVDQHRITIELPADWPEEPPRLSMETPVFHPNISADGIISLGELGMVWHSDLTLDIIIERLWDLIRGAAFDLENAINPSAARWYSSQSGLQFPLDERSLSPHHGLNNVIRYRSRTRRLQSGSAKPDAKPFVIDGQEGDSGPSQPIHIIE